MPTLRTLCILSPETEPRDAIPGVHDGEPNKLIKGLIQAYTGQIHVQGAIETLGEGEVRIVENFQ